MRTKLTIIALLFAGICSGQGRKELLRFADDAFKKEEYRAAAELYLKILNQTTDDSERSFPYEVKSVYIPKKEKQPDSLKNTVPVDTLAKDTVKKAVVTAPDTSKKGPENIIVPIRDQYVVHQVAESYRLGHDYENAEKWYKKSVESGQTAYPDDLYWYGVALMSNGQYDSALVQLEKYIELGTGNLKKLAEKKVLSCYFANDKRSRDTANIVVELDTIINGGTTSFAPVFYGEKDMLAFASARSGGTTEENINSSAYSDIYLSSKDGNGWGKPQKLGDAINTISNEQPGVMSADRQKLFFSRWNILPSGKKEHAIYMSRFLGNQWLHPIKLNQNVNVEGYYSMNPTLNLDGSILFFTSNRPGGQGKMDIWYCPVDELGNAGAAVNLGPVINTMEDEVTPFYDYLTQTLYFSSAGHPGLGGLDIFKTYGDEQEMLWSTPINLKAPVNSSKDDAYFVVYKDQSVGYFASDRRVCTGCNSGACYKIYALEKGPTVVKLVGTVYNKQTNEILPNTLVTLKDVLENVQNAYFITDEEGKYTTYLREQVDWYIKAQKSKFFGDQATVTTMGTNLPKEIVQDFYLDPIPSGDIVIPGIEYDFDKATLRPKSKLILDTLADKLKLNDNLFVEISSHTDSRGNNDYNMKLSHERAKSVVEYLISKGIAPERLLPQGYGESKLLVTDDEIKNMKSEEEKEAGHQKNRRTAFKILKEEELKMQ